MKGPASSNTSSRSRSFIAICLLTLGFLHAAVLQAATYTTPRALLVGDTFVLTRDSWTSPPGGSTYDGDVLPKVDTNSGTGGDNLYYRRHNVARAWPTDTGYWFTGSDQNMGGSSLFSVE